MTDIVERLRSLSLLVDAAARKDILAGVSEIERLRFALKSIAEFPTQREHALAQCRQLQLYADDELKRRAPQPTELE